MPPRPGRAAPEDFQAIAEALREDREPREERLRRPAPSRQVNRREDVSGRVQDDEVGADRPDVEADVTLDLSRDLSLRLGCGRPAGGRSERRQGRRPPPRSREQGGDGLPRLCRPEVRDVRGPRRECRPDGPLEPREGGDEESLPREAEDLREGADEPAAVRAPPGDHDRRRRRPPLQERREVVPRDRETEAVGDLRERRPLLLQVDHVRSREDRAAARHGGRPRGGGREGGELRSRQAEPTRLLLEERPGPRRAGLVRREVAEASVRSEDEELGGVAADLDDAAGARMPVPHPGRDGEEGVDGREPPVASPRGLASDDSDPEPSSSREGREVVEEPAERFPVVAVLPAAERGDELSSLVQRDAPRRHRTEVEPERQHGRLRVPLDRPWRGPA